MIFEKSQDKIDFEKLHPQLLEIVEFMSDYYQDHFKREPTVTSIVRHDGSTHQQWAPYRFIDIRCHDIPLEEAEKLRDLVNKIYPYGLKNNGQPGETIVPLDHHLTSPQFTAPHFHVQISSSWLTKGDTIT